MECTARAGSTDGGSGKNFAVSIGRSQSGATAELLLPTVLPTTAKCQHNAATTTVMGESVRQDMAGSSSYNAD
jgi:hypothetical protein